MGSPVARHYWDQKTLDFHQKQRPNAFYRSKVHRLREVPRRVRRVRRARRGYGVRRVQRVRRLRRRIKLCRVRRVRRLRRPRKVHRARSVGRAKCAQCAQCENCVDAALSFGNVALAMFFQDSTILLFGRLTGTACCQNYCMSISPE